jgi:type II secretory pathway component PulF
MERDISPFKAFLAIIIIAALALRNVMFVTDNPELGVVTSVIAGFALVGLLIWRLRLSRREFCGSAGRFWWICIGCVTLAFTCLLVNIFGMLNEFALVGAILAGIAMAGFLGYLLYSAVTVWMRRRTTNRIVIGQMATVVRQNLPLATGLALAARSETGAARRHLQRISHLLAQGAPLSEAVSEGFPDCPSLPLTLIVAGERSGQLAAALEEAENHLVERGRRDERVDTPVWPFMLTIIAFMILVVSGLMVSIVPKFKEIFKDFGTELPYVTITLIYICDFFVESGLLLILLVLALIGIPSLIYLNLRPRRLPIPGWTSRVADWIRWHCPGWRAVECHTGMAMVLRTMRIAVRAGMPLDEAASLASGVDVNFNLRPLISDFAGRIAKGANPYDAARQAGLGEVTAIALAAGSRCDDLDAGLRYAAEYNDAITNRLWILLRNLAWPIATLLIGAMVAFIALAMFEPLIKLINSVGWGK